MILTLTPNPSLDLLFETDHLAWDDANRMADPRRRPGGQGINVARVVRVHGGDAIAVALVGGRTGDELIAMLEAEGVAAEPVQSPGDTRTFVAVRELATGRSMLLNARGPARSEQDAVTLLETVERVLRDLRPRWLACCGSIPTGMPADFYCRAAALAHAHHVRVVVDCDGIALQSAASCCELLVPNRHEAERLTGMSITDAASACSAARRMISDNPRVRRAAVTLGEAGAVLVSAAGAWHARAPALRSGSAVGAGDAFLAALLHFDESADDDALRHAVAAGSAALLSRGTDLVALRDAHDLLARVQVERVAG